MSNNGYLCALSKCSYSENWWWSEIIDVSDVIFMWIYYMSNHQSMLRVVFVQHLESHRLETICLLCISLFLLKPYFLLLSDFYLLPPTFCSCLCPGSLHVSYNLVFSSFLQCLQQGIVHRQGQVDVHGQTDGSLVAGELLPLGQNEYGHMVLFLLS